MWTEDELLEIDEIGRGRRKREGTHCNFNFFSTSREFFSVSVIFSHKKVGITAGKIAQVVITEVGKTSVKNLQTIFLQKLCKLHVILSARQLHKKQHLHACETLIHSFGCWRRRRVYKAVYTKQCIQTEYTKLWCWNMIH